MSITPQGYRYGKDPKSSHPFWDAIKDIISKITGSASVDDTTGTPSVEVTKTENDDTVNFDFKFSGLKGEKGDTGATGATGETGPQGPQGEPGATPTDYVKNLTITDENGVVTFDTEKGDGTTESKTVEIPKAGTDNLLAEINDSVVENETDGYDFHTLTETENNGTKNEVGKFYIARQQLLLQNLDFVSLMEGTLYYKFNSIAQSGDLDLLKLTLATVITPDLPEATQINVNDSTTVVALSLDAASEESYGYNVEMIGKRYVSDGTTYIDYGGAVFNVYTPNDKLSSYMPHLLGIVLSGTIDFSLPANPIKILLFDPSGGIYINIPAASFTITGLN